MLKLLPRFFGRVSKTISKFTFITAAAILWIFIGLVIYQKATNTPFVTDAFAVPKFSIPPGTTPDTAWQTINSSVNIAGTVTLSSGTQAPIQLFTGGSNNGAPVQLWTIGAGGSEDFYTDITNWGGTFHWRLGSSSGEVEEMALSSTGLNINGYETMWGRDILHVNGSAMQINNSPSNTSLALSTGGTTRMTIDANGNVGAGTASPYSELSVYRNVSLTPSLTHNSQALMNVTNALTDLTFTIDQNNPFSASIQHRHAGLDGYYYPIALNPLGGNIGIGTTWPVQKFQVVGGGANNLGEVCGNSQCLHFNNNGWIYTGDTSNNVYGNVGLAAANLWSAGDIYFGLGGAYLSSWLNQAVRTDSSPTFNNLTINTALTVNGTLTAGTYRTAGNIFAGTVNATTISGTNSIGTPTLTATTINGTNTYSNIFQANDYRSVSNPGYYHMAPDGTSRVATWYADNIYTNYGEAGNGGFKVWGNLTVVGSKSGYVVDFALNDSNEVLNQGDVVTLSSKASDSYSVGEIPLVRVRKATSQDRNQPLWIVDQQATKTKDTYDYAHSPIQPGQSLTVVTLGSYKEAQVNNEGGEIKTGTPLAVSSIPGVATKATQSGMILGYAMETLSGDNGMVKVFYSPTSYFDADSYLTSTDGSTITEALNGQFQVKDVGGNLVTKVAQLAEVVVGNLRAGVINAQRVVINGVDVINEINSLKQENADLRHRVEVLEQKVNASTAP